MAKIIQTEFQRKRKERNQRIVKEFIELRRKNPGASNADCIRGLNESFKVSSTVVRGALKEGGVL